MFKRYYSIGQTLVTTKKLSYFSQSDLHRLLPILCAVIRTIFLRRLIDGGGDLRRRFSIDNDAVRYSVARRGRIVRVYTALIYITWKWCQLIWGILNWQSVSSIIQTLTMTYMTLSNTPFFDEGEASTSTVLWSACAYADNHATLKMRTSISCHWSN